MKSSAALVLLAFGGWTSATFKKSCARGCANDVGFDCSLLDVSCPSRTSSQRRC
jgi:hypothetical protein